MDNVELLVNVIKAQAEVFLVNIGEFYPFGTYINNIGEIVPVGAYLEDDMPQSQNVMEMLEKCFKSKLINDYKVAALATDVLSTVNGVKTDALQIRFFISGKEVSEVILKYVLNKDKVEFSI